MFSTLIALPSSRAWIMFPTLISAVVAYSIFLAIVLFLSLVLQFLQYCVRGFDHHVRQRLVIGANVLWVGAVPDCRCEDELLSELGACVINHYHVLLHAVLLPNVGHLRARSAMR